MTLSSIKTPAPCSTGDLAARARCGWNLPTTHAGYGFGHNVLPWLLIAALVIALVVSKQRKRKPAPRPTARPKTRTAR